MLVCLSGVFLMSFTETLSSNKQNKREVFSFSDKAGFRFSDIVPSAPSLFPSYPSIHS